MFSMAFVGLPLNLWRRGLVKKTCCPEKRVEWGQELTKILYEPTSPNFPHRAAGQNKLF
jgi:hypothetical protein